jgi:biopolymer transport protein ExbD
MKFARHARATKASLEAAPWVAVMFLLVIFLMLGGLLYTPGVHLQLPVAEDLPGTDAPAITVALDSQGRLYFENQQIDEARLKQRLAEAVRNAPEKPTLVVQADKAASYESLVRLTQLARAAGIDNAVLATLSGPFSQAPVRP